MWAILSLTYLLGAIPSGLLIAMGLRGIDPRKGGSGNIGATNILRVAGKKEAILTLACDILKGFSPIMVARLFKMEDDHLLFIGLTVIIGHIFPVFLWFKGGKGVATSFGVFLGLSPSIALMALGMWLMGVYLGKASSIGALTAFGSLPLLAYLFRPSAPFVSFSVLVSVLVCMRHYENIQRLIKGEERS